MFKFNHTFDELREIVFDMNIRQFEWVKDNISMMGYIKALNWIISCKDKTLKDIMLGLINVYEKEIKKYLH